MSTLPRYIRKGRALPIGTIRTHGGVKKKKTAQGWVPVKEGAKKKKKKTTPKKKTAPKKTSQRIVRDDDSFEKHAEELAAQIGPGLIVTSGYSHKAGGGAIGWHGFRVGLSPANLKRAIGNKPDARKTEALVEQVVSEFSVNEPGAPEHYPRDWVEEDIRGSASRSGARARQEIKLISAALAVAVRETKAHTALGHNDDRQGHIRALEILTEHFGRDK
jgi:hypothetical protein